MLGVEKSRIFHGIFADLKNKSAQFDYWSLLVGEMPANSCQNGKSRTYFLLFPYSQKVRKNYWKFEENMLFFLYRHYEKYFSMVWH